MGSTYCYLKSPSPTLNKEHVNEELEQVWPVALSVAKQISQWSEENIVPWSQLVSKLTDGNGVVEYQFTPIQAAQAIRYLEDNNLIFRDDQHNSLICYRTYKLTSDFERRQKELQDGWLKASEIQILNALNEELKEVNKSTKLLSIKELEQRGPELLEYYTLSCDLENSKDRRRRPIKTQ